MSRRGLRTPFVRVVKDGATLPAARFTRSGGAGAEVGDQVADDLLLKLILDGATVVLQGLHRVWPPIGDFAGQLSAELGCPVQVNAYLTPASSRGFSAHYDVHDVFVLQIAGEKRWHVHEPVHPLPLRSQPWTGHRAAVEEAATGPPVLDTVLRPGDALYLPRGYLHSATALGGVCAHLTVGIHPVTRHALVQALTALAADEPGLREALPLGIDVADPAALADEVGETVRGLVKRLADASPDEVTAHLRSQVWLATRAAPVPPIAQSAAIATLDADTAVRRREHLRCRLHPAGDRIVLELADRTITLPAATEAALAVLLAGAPVTVAEVPGLDPDEQLVLVRRLLREAVVVPAP